MAKAIIWNRLASNKFNAIIAYLEQEWGENVTRNFVINTYKIIELIANYPEMGTLENKEKQIRGFVITKHNTLFYRVEEDKIILLTFFDTRQSPGKTKN
ncbi:type II toxin-antitoxin system RelE/ParE family toxin [Mucilaginibacter sp. cycad4]|uniref:type II toxin-antitoxin system RelE/ParE family toxin n=1 Tax=Mucilaginibacter sp. cycad4 TaxID=3342096 RepID=UPI002AABD2F4|nr:type II toxin-antitoxin system RelE/ParE family toxin [Mucilaginibacter gossypii]WPU97659.1 type II toxin-antitoxin system RelE/ParE family toxin [Mucilaginibacter gossypii]